MRFLLIERQLLAAAHVTRLVWFLAKPGSERRARGALANRDTCPNIADFNPVVSLSRHRYLFRSNDQIPSKLLHK